MLPWLTLVALVVVAVLGRNLFQRLTTDRIEAFNDKRRSTSLLVSRGEFVEGNRHLDVALALTDSTLFYENGEMQASIDLEWVREVEYDTELSSGPSPATGSVLRLRSDSQIFEFVIPSDMMTRWNAMLPSRARPERAAAKALEINDSKLVTDAS